MWINPNNAQPDNLLHVVQILDNMRSWLQKNLLSLCVSLFSPVFIPKKLLTCPPHQTALPLPPPAAPPCVCRASSARRCGRRWSRDKCYNSSGQATRPGPAISTDVFGECFDGKKAATSAGFVCFFWFEGQWVCFNGFQKHWPCLKGFNLKKENQTFFLMMVLIPTSVAI